MATNGSFWHTVLVWPECICVCRFASCFLSLPSSAPPSSSEARWRGWTADGRALPLCQWWMEDDVILGLTGTRSYVHKGSPSLWGQTAGLLLIFKSTWQILYVGGAGFMFWFILFNPTPRHWEEAIQTIRWETKLLQGGEKPTGDQYRPSHCYWSIQVRINMCQHCQKCITYSTTKRVLQKLHK